MPPTGKTGMHTHIRVVTEYLTSVGVTVDLITPFSWYKGLAVIIFGLRYILEPISGTAGALWYRFWHAVFLTRALRRTLSANTSAVVYAQDPLSVRAALRARVSPTQQVVGILHFVGISEADEWIDNGRFRANSRADRQIRAQEANILPAAPRLIYLSEARRRALLDTIPALTRVPSEVIPNFLTSHGSSQPTSAAPLADLVTVGRLEPSKNHSFLLRVVAAARRLGTDLSLDIYGDGSLRAALLRDIETLKLSDLVRLHGFRRDLSLLLPRYTLYVHSAIKEGLPFALIEALAAGLPIYTTKVGGIADLDSTAGSIHFWTLQDADDAAAHLLAFLASPSAVTQARIASRNHFATTYHVDAVGPRLLQFLIPTHQSDSPHPPTSPDTTSQ